MTIQQYLREKEARFIDEKSPRRYCAKCKKPLATCYCVAVQPFCSSPQFVILIHRLEARRSVATGRMAHLCLSNSLLFEGTDFTDHPGVNALISDRQNYCVVLARGNTAVDLTEIAENERRRLFPPDKRLVVFVIDGTWAQARRMRRLSRNLKGLPSVCFTPETPSRFLVRKQPEAHCCSTIEAIHTCISLVGLEPQQPRNNLLTAFAYMVNQQIEYEATSNQFQLPACVMKRVSRRLLRR